MKSLLKTALVQDTTFIIAKETTFQRADFALQLLMFVKNAEKERRIFTIFFLSIFCQLLYPRF